MERMLKVNGTISRVAERTEEGNSRVTMKRMENFDNECQDYEGTDNLSPFLRRESQELRSHMMYDERTFIPRNKSRKKLGDRNERNAQEENVKEKEMNIEMEKE
uniref:Uncharacterized protein n=1 Tax=Vespula pensylvanica TaxID=30213 RepID=A0A834PB08_VESPE|nr:hypothetical protein H0235_002440 [Vespula pensylvanica]